MAELILRDVRKTYGTIEVLHGIDLDIRSGEFVVFVGPSGCGKSTLLRAIAGLEEISSGTFLIDGALMNHVAPSKRGIAMVFQSYALYPHMTVFDNMAFGMKIAGMKKPEIARRVAQAAEVLQSVTLSGPLSTGVVGRAAAARRHRPRHCPRSQGFPVRRAAVEPRCRAAGRHAA
ncbi:Vitamin B12 import ATP-binding protein BtuD [Frigidibacter albus]